MKQNLHSWLVFTIALSIVCGSIFWMGLLLGKKVCREEVKKLWTLQIVQGDKNISYIAELDADSIVYFSNKKVGVYVNGFYSNISADYIITKKNK